MSVYSTRNLECKCAGLLKKGKVSFDIAQYLIIKITRYTLLPGRPVQSNTVSFFSGKRPATLQLMRENTNYPPPSTANYSFIQLNELEQCRVNKTCPIFSSQHVNLGCLSRKSETLSTAPKHIFSIVMVTVENIPSKH